MFFLISMSVYIEIISAGSAKYCRGTKNTATLFMVDLLNCSQNDIANYVRFSGLPLHPTKNTQSG